MDKQTSGLETGFYNDDGNAIGASNDWLVADLGGDVASASTSTGGGESDTEAASSVDEDGGSQIFVGVGKSAPLCGGAGARSAPVMLMTVMVITVQRVVWTA